jgi:hypothetical protein
MCVMSMVCLTMDVAAKLSLRVGDDVCNLAVYI